MNLIEISMFKYFSRYHGRDEMFISLYKHYKLKENPHSIEKYLQQADPRNVFMAAFYFYPNSVFKSYDYWQDFQLRFNTFRENNKDEFPIDDVMDFKGKAGHALRKNWDKNDFRKTESRLDTSERYGINLPEETIRTIAAEHERQGHIDLKMRAAAKNIQAEEEDDPLAGFDMVDLEQDKSARHKMRDDEVTFNMKKGGSRVTFNQSVSYELLLGGCNFSFAQLGRNKNGETCIILNNESGVTVQSLSADKKRTNLTISSKVLCEKLAQLLDIKEEYRVLKIKKIAQNEKVAAFIVSK